MRMFFYLLIVSGENEDRSATTAIRHEANCYELKDALHVSCSVHEEGQSAKIDILAYGHRGTRNLFATMIGLAPRLSPHYMGDRLQHSFRRHIPGKRNLHLRAHPVCDFSRYLRSLIQIEIKCAAEERIDPVQVPRIQSGHPVGWQHRDDLLRRRLQWLRIERRCKC